MLSELKPMLRSWDIPGTITFYTELLGFTCEAYDAEYGWAHLCCDDIVIMISGPNSHEGDERPQFTGSLYFMCDDVDALWERVKGRAKVCYPIEDFPYGMREFAIYDNNGYLLQFGKEHEVGE